MKNLQESDYEEVLLTSNKFSMHLPLHIFKITEERLWQWGEENVNINA